MKLKVAIIYNIQYDLNYKGRGVKSSQNNKNPRNMQGKQQVKASSH